MNAIARRAFLRRLAVTAPSLIGLARCGESPGTAPPTAPAAPAPTPEPAPAPEPPPPVVPPGDAGPDYGALLTSLDSPEFEIPEGFRCVRLSKGDAASSVRRGLHVPEKADGMAAFPLPNGNVRLIRNHERGYNPRAEPIAEPYYDLMGRGGTTSLEVRISGTGGDLRVELVDEFISLAGTSQNCAGGPTPWGSWLSCEETTRGLDIGFREPHGYVFEVPVSATGPVDPAPLKAMGRFKHEAAAVDPKTGFVYETEDMGYDQEEERGSGFYRFLPDRPGVLSAGGRLQMLAITDWPRYVTVRGQTPGLALPAHWVDIADPDPPDAEENPVAVYRQGLAQGAASFDRLEGAWYGDDGIYIVSTFGGNHRSGQVFHYRPTSEDAGELTLIFESPSGAVLNGPDNIVASPRGGVLLCEDGGNDDLYIRGLNREGHIFDFVRQPNAIGEFAGTCFSPDGRVLFFNVQPDGGTTYAMWGPWETGPV